MSCIGLKSLSMYLCDHVSFVRLSWESQVAFFLPTQAFLFTTYFGNCLVSLGGYTWCACGCDCLGIPLRPVVLGESCILSLRKATKLHLWSDRGMKCHKQLLHRQPAVTMAVEPVALRQQSRGTHSKNISLKFSTPVWLHRNPNPKSNNARIAHEARAVNSRKLNKKHFHVAVAQTVQSKKYAAD